MVKEATIQQAAVLPFAYKKGILKILLVTSIGAKRWILPKGHIEPGLTDRESAEFEAFEEAGVVGNTQPRSIGTYTYRKRPEKGGELYRVRVFAMEVTRILDKYPERALRKRRWMSVRKASKAVQEPDLKTLIERFEKEHSQTAA